MARLQVLWSQAKLIKWLHIFATPAGLSLLACNLRARGCGAFEPEPTYTRRFAAIQTANGTAWCAAKTASNSHPRAGGHRSSHHISQVAAAYAHAPEPAVRRSYKPCGCALSGPRSQGHEEERRPALSMIRRKECGRRNLSALPSSVCRCVTDCQTTVPTAEDRPGMLQVQWYQGWVWVEC